jgi:hypothetical protein
LVVYSQQNAKILVGITTDSMEFFHIIPLRGVLYG